MTEIRRIDEIGRIVISKSIRQKVFGGNTMEGFPMEIHAGDDGTIVLKPYKPVKQQLLTDKEIEVFNWYLEDAGVTVAFGNTDFCEVYHKIVGEKESIYARSMMEKFNF